MSEPLTWLNDPYYFDPQPQPVNQWLNANELLLFGQRDKVLLSDSKLNLFPIMVRRVDFVREKSTDRILRRFPYIKLLPEEREILSSKSLLMAEQCRNYFYRSENRSIMEWHKQLQTFLEREFIPLPFLRCCQKFLTVDLSDRVFSSARGEEFVLPNILTPELAYLAGIVNGDGNLQKYTLRIIDFSEENIRSIHSRFLRLFQQDGNILFKTDNSPELVITNLWVVRLFSFLTSQSINIRKYNSLKEPLIFQDKQLKSYYWSGLMDSDGCYKQNKATFSTISESFALSFLQYLNANNISAVLRKGIGDTSIIYISKDSHEKLKSLLICMHPEKKSDFFSLSNSPSRLIKIFSQFNRENIISDYFNFELLKGVYVLGLSNNICGLRGELSLRSFSEKINVHHRTIKDIENENQGISIQLLAKILKSTQISLMPYLSERNSLLRYKIKNATPIKLITQPSEELEYLSQNILFYKHSFKLKNNIQKSKLILKKLFDVETKTDIVKNKLLQNFFFTYFRFKVI
ncbi:MAG: hypothetical protein ACFFDW_13740 [Candidatus Thorarchaeota archaeon]